MYTTDEEIPGHVEWYFPDHQGHAIKIEYYCQLRWIGAPVKA